jgi:glutamate-1-semialdehyde 2,1-aminomutase
VLKLNNSKKLLEKSKELIPGLTQTFSRAAPSFVEGIYPVYAQKANGSHFWDVDGNNFLDYLMGLGPITLGYNYKSVNDSVIAQLNEGVLFSLPHPIELELSELLCKTIPNAEMVKFEKSGSNAVTGAVRAARAITKRDKIAYCGSAGVWHDWQAIMVSRNEGVPEFNRQLIKLFDYNDIEGLEQIFKDNPHEIAAVVIEPTHFEKPKNDFLKIVRELTQKHNSLLILDEIVTGFRFDIQGGQKYFDFDGDLVCFGKGMANGFPLSAITGKKEFMKIFEKLWVSSTNNSETLSIAACIATISEMKKRNTINYCWKLGEKLFNSWNDITNSYGINAKMIGYPIRMTLQCFDSHQNESRELKALILQEMISRRIFISPGPSFISYSHSLDDIKKTLDSLHEICKFIQENSNQENFSSLLKGNLPKTVWTMDMKPIKKHS